VDLNISIIVVQHNPPPVMAFILGHMLRWLKANGIASFQVPNLFGTNQPEGWILREPLGIVDILVAGNPAVDGLAQ
jgi:hypothetical protein